jgi:gliding motility-associated-like protein
VSEIDITINASSDAGTITALETSLCEGTTTTVSSDGDTGGSWSSSDLAIATVDATGQVTAVGPGTAVIRYTVAGTPPCLSDVSALDITVNASPSAGTISVLETTLCEGTTTTVSSDGDTGGSWSSSDPALATVDSMGQVTSLVLGTVAIRYTIAGTAPCLSVVSEIIIRVNVLPTVIATSTDTMICLGESIILSGVGANSYIWDNGVIDNVPFIPLLGTTLYTVIGTDSDGCANSDQISITTNPFTSVTLPNSLRICAGVAEIIDAGIGFSNYLWSTGETTQRIAVSSGGDYTVSVTNSDGCDTAATVNVVASDLAVILRIDVGQFEVQTNTLTAVVTGTGDYEFSLDDFVYQNSERFSDLYPGSYTVYVRDKNGCGTVSMDVVIIGGPAFFTPNQDGYNDTWQVIAVDTIPDARIYIFDRYGKLMKQISATGLGWDGTYNGSPMPSSDYWYVVELSDGRSFNGNFALKR